jgi:hypothetical protein
MKRTTLLVVTWGFAGLLAQTDAVRFDHLVRNDFFAGFAGNKDALERGMAKTAEIIAREPNHAEALVWHGSGQFTLSNQAFAAGRREEGMKLWEEGLAKMDKAVALAPDQVGVRVPRGATVTAASHFVPDFLKPELLKRAQEDFGRVYEMQKGRLGELSEHARGELLIALADVHDRTGEKNKAREFFSTLAQTMPETAYGKNAKKWLETGSLGARERGCLGCHTPARAAR